MKNYVDSILEEILGSLKNLDLNKSKIFTDNVLESNKIVVAGAGRVGLFMRGFSMRLAQMGFHASALGDSNVPTLTERDLLVIGSGSGETQTIYDIAKRAKEHAVVLILITSNLESRISKISNLAIQINTPNKLQNNLLAHSIQPMTSLFEQSLCIYLDSVVLNLMDKLGETSDSMWSRHSILE